MVISCVELLNLLLSRIFLLIRGGGVGRGVPVCVRGKECRTLRESECRTRELELPNIIHSRMSDAKKYRFPSAEMYPASGTLCSNYLSTLGRSRAVNVSISNILERFRQKID